MNPIQTAVIKPSETANILLTRQSDGTIHYASFQAPADVAIDILRRALIHLVAEHAGMATIPAAAAIVANGHNLEPAPDSSRVLVAASGPSDPIPPLPVPKTKPTSTAPTERRKPGPKPGTPRRRKVDALEEW